MHRLFDGNWLIKAFQEVTTGDKTPSVDLELSKTRQLLMPELHRPNRTGLTQLMQANANTLETFGHNNCWMHFQHRVHDHVRLHLQLSEAEYKALSSDQRKARKMQMLRVTQDLLRKPNDALTSDACYHDWLRSERVRLQIDDAVGEWDDKPLLYHLKVKPKAHRFLLAMSIMSADREAAGRHAFSLFPLRRNMVPKHVRFDKKSLHDTLQALKNERQGKKRKAPGDDRFTFDGVIDTRCVRTTNKWTIKDGFTTDGICARVQQQRVQSLPKKRQSPTSLPQRGIWAIDELKRVSRLEELHVVGIDPGKKELVVAVDQDAGGRGRSVRYTQRERQKDMRSRQYADEMSRSKPDSVRCTEEDLANTNSYSANVETFCLYVWQRQEGLTERLAFYAELGHRRRRWKSYLKSQQSEEKLYQKLKAIHKKGDSRTLVLAYGSWGLIAGRAGNAANKGLPPSIGVGLMRKLGKRFLVSPTPEQFTSKTCCRCLHPCGPWADVETKMKPILEKRMKHYNGIRGLRICQNEDCKLPQNRDRTGASNIGLQFTRLFAGRGPIRSMTAEDLEFHRHNLCLGCDED
tara:strand:+ start:987 stop:2714 length:1728 start_codon:yes stop_codon:yes gene_type:complete